MTTATPRLPGTRIKDGDAVLMISSEEYAASLPAYSGPALDEYRAAVSHLAAWARTNRHCSTGMQMWTALCSVAFGGPGNTVDIGTISWSWEGQHLDQLVTVIRGRGRHGWPTDLVPDQELQAWLNARDAVASGELPRSHSES